MVPPQETQGRLGMADLAIGPNVETTQAGVGYQGETYLTLVSGLSGTPMPSYADSLSSREIWALVYYLESLVPRDHRLDPNQLLGEEQQGWMALRMGGMMGGGMTVPGMMYRSR